MLLNVSSGIASHQYSREIDVGKMIAIVIDGCLDDRRRQMGKWIVDEEVDDDTFHRGIY